MKDTLSIICVRVYVRLRPVCGDFSWEDVWCVNMNRAGVCVFLCVHGSCLLAAQENGFRPLNRIKVSQLRHEGSLLLHVYRWLHTYTFLNMHPIRPDFPTERDDECTPLSQFLCVNADHVITGSFYGPLVYHMYTI